MYLRKSSVFHRRNSEEAGRRAGGGEMVLKTENEGGFFKRTSIRYMIFVYFTVTALAASIFIGLSLYSRMSKQMTDTMQEENQILIDQLNRSVDVWLSEYHEAFGFPLLRRCKKRGSGR